MKRWMILGALLAATAASAQTPDEAAIRGIAAQQEAAWNAHDVAAWARPFAPDAQFVTALGLWWKSWDELQRKMGYAFRVMFAQSRMHVDQVEVTSLSPQIAMAHIAFTLENARAPDGSDVGTVHVIQSQTLRKAGGEWQIASAQDSAVLPVMPPPPAPSPAATVPSAAPATPKRCFLANSKGDCIIPKK